MYQQIDETIHVLASFAGNKIQPLIFRWGNRSYQVKKVHLVHINRTGRDKIYHFAVTDNANYYKLSFNSETLQWRLTEKYMS